MKTTIYKILLLSCFTLIGLRSQAQIITTIAGSGTGGYSGDGGAATAAQFSTPIGVAVDGSGTMYVADQHNNSVRKITATGIVSTFAGTTSGFGGDGGAASMAQLFQPYRVAVDGSGNVYINDQGNTRIRKVSTSGVISTIAGTGTWGYTGDGGAATSADIVPGGMAVDAAGNVYLGCNETIRKINTAGIISTIAGTGTAGFSGDGGAATAAQLQSAGDLTIDAAGNIYVCVQGRIRKIDASGVISTIAGTGTPGNTGDGGTATTAQVTPEGIGVDASGNIYFADVHNQRIRRITTAGIISTYAGNGIGGYSGDGGAATAAEFMFPSDVSIDASGNVYVSDQNNNVVRKIARDATIIQSVANPSFFFKVFPNPTTGRLSITIHSNIVEQAQVIITNSVGEKVGEWTITTNTPTEILLDEPAGVYWMSAFTAHGSQSEKIIR